MNQNHLIRIQGFKQNPNHASDQEKSKEEEREELVVMVIKRQRSAEEAVMGSGWQQGLVGSERKRKHEEER